MSEEPKTPMSGNWTKTGRGHWGAFDDEWEADIYQGPNHVQVLSAVETAEGHSGLLVPHFHVSVSQLGQVATNETMAAVRRDFQMEDAEEDNHGNGIVRHLWREVYGKPAECHCKNEEPPIVDGEREWRP